MCVLPSVWPDFPENVVFYRRPRGASLFRRLPVLEPDMGAILNAFWAAVFKEFLYVFVRFNVSWGVQREGIFTQF